LLSDAAHAYLREHHVAAKAPAVAHYGMKQLYLEDPDGYAICLQHPNAHWAEGYTGRRA